MFEKIKSLIQGQRVNIVEVDGDKEITRIRYVDGADREVNQILNRFDLLGYEIRSDTVEIFYGKKFMGRGYIADLAGMTVNMEWIRPPDSEYEDAAVSDEDPKDGEAIITGECIQNAKPPAWAGGKCQIVPCMTIEGAGQVKIIRFEYLREIEGAIIDDERSIRYEKDPNMRIEIKMPDGKIGRGFVCSPTGKTIRIIRDVKVKVKVRKVIEGKEEITEEYTAVKFAGALGKLSSGDRLPKLLSGMSGRENLIQLVIAFVAGAILMGVL